MGKITDILRKHFKSCQKSTAQKKVKDVIDKKIVRGGNQPKRTIAAPKLKETKLPPVKNIGFGHMPRHGNKISGSEV